MPGKFIIILRPKLFLYWNFELCKILRVIYEALRVVNYDIFAYVFLFLNNPLKKKKIELQNNVISLIVLLLSVYNLKKIHVSNNNIHVFSSNYYIVSIIIHFFFFLLFSMNISLPCHDAVVIKKMLSNFHFWITPNYKYIRT